MLATKLNNSPRQRSFQPRPRGAVAGHRRPEQAKKHALAAYKWAWADGEPYVHRYELNKARALLESSASRSPSCRLTIPAKDEKFPWEDEVTPRSRNYGLRRKLRIPLRRSRKSEQALKASYIDKMTWVVDCRLIKRLDFYAGISRIVSIESLPGVRNWQHRVVNKKKYLSITPRFDHRYKHLVI